MDSPESDDHPYRECADEDGFSPVCPPSFLTDLSLSPAPGFAGA